MARRLSARSRWPTSPISKDCRKQGGNNYSATISSGSAVIGAPGTSSLGSLTGSALENSNVDMSTEFTNLIIAERGFQANAKSVTTFDQIAQDTINLVR